MSRMVLASLLALGALSAAAAEDPATPQVVNYTPFPATLGLSQGPRTPIFSMILKMTMKRNPDGSWQLDQAQEPLMTEAQLRDPAAYLGCPVQPGTLEDSLAYKPRAEIFVRRLALKTGEIEVRTPTAAVRAPVEDGCVVFDEKSGPWRVPYLGDGDTLEVRGVEEKPVVVRLVRDFIPWALVRYQHGEMMPAPARLDTVVLAPRLDRAFFVWRATFPTAPQIRLVEFRAVEPDDFIESRPESPQEPRAARLEREHETREMLRRCPPPKGPVGEPCSVPSDPPKKRR
jgi:hypothetical protein